jgi:enoyl-[acyl-carrier-protein] reductase (NADH)
VSAHGYRFARHRTKSVLVATRRRRIDGSVVAHATACINVNVVSPGFIEVGLRPGVSIPYREKIKHDIPWGRFGQPDEIASAVKYLCSDEAEFVTGSVLSVDGGSSAGRFHLPISAT